MWRVLQSSKWTDLSLVLHSLTYSSIAWHLDKVVTTRRKKVLHWDILTCSFSRRYQGFADISPSDQNISREKYFSPRYSGRDWKVETWWCCRSWRLSPGRVWPRRLEDREDIPGSARLHWTDWWRWSAGPTSPSCRPADLRYNSHTDLGWILSDLRGPGPRWVRSEMIRDSYLPRCWGFQSYPSQLLHCSRHKSLHWGLCNQPKQTSFIHWIK